MSGFDMVRALAAISVVWVHAGRSAEWHDLALGEIGRWGTTYLNLIAGFFMVFTLSKALSKSGGVGSLANFTKHRVFRILAPFAVWSGVYLLARVANYLLFGKATSIAPEWSLLVHGTTYHLWFLPYLAIISLLTLPLVYLGMGSAIRQRVMAGVFLAAALVLMTMPTPAGLPLDPHKLSIIVGTLFNRSPAFLLGVGFGLLFVSNVRPRIPLPLGMACIVIAAFSAGCSTLTYDPESSSRFLFRIAAVCAFLVAMMPWRASVLTAGASLGRLGFGVYLCHLLFVEGGHAFASAMKLPSAISTDVMVFVFAVAASFAFAAAMKKSKALSWLIP